MRSDEYYILVLVVPCLATKLIMSTSYQMSGLSVLTCVSQVVARLDPLHHHCLIAYQIFGARK